MFHKPLEWSRGRLNQELAGSRIIGASSQAKLQKQLFRLLLRLAINNVKRHSFWLRLGAKNMNSGPDQFVIERELSSIVPRWPAYVRRRCCDSHGLTRLGELVKLLNSLGGIYRAQLFALVSFHRRDNNCGGKQTYHK